MSRIRRALISVYDKTDLLPFVQGLAALGIKIVSTGGTAKLLRESEIPVEEVAEFTGFPEILAGRVKTLHPRVHGAILASRKDSRHLLQARRLGLRLIDLVVVNLYPFEATARRRRAPLSQLIEQIDIGGVALMRSAAKNFQSVGIICRASQYPEILAELQRNRGRLSEASRLRLAVESFTETACYDQMIHQVLAHRQKNWPGWPLASAKGGLTTAPWPSKLILGAVLRQALRYGENPHQKGAWYRWSLAAEGSKGLNQARQLHGKELSFNNLLDIDAAIQVVSAFGRPAAVVIKHTNPCGAACAPTLSEAFRRAFACDPISAFGGIVGLNRPVDEGTARTISSAGFLECVAAPSFKREALRRLRGKKNLRLVQVPLSKNHLGRCVEIKPISGGLLLQDPDQFLRPASRWRLVTRARPTAGQWRDLDFAWRMARFVRSNAIVIAKGERTVGIGAGQMSRVDSVRLALRHAGARARGAVLASDGFFPKPDGPQAAVRSGVRAIVQPGGSVQDPQVIRVAEKAGIPMLLTGERHFRH